MSPFTTLARPFLALAAALACQAGVAVAQQASTNLLVLDIDAEPILDTGQNVLAAGAVFNVDTRQPATATPAIETSAAAGAPFKYVSGMALSPADGRLYIADIGVDPGDQPKILALDGQGGGVQTIWSGAPLVQPWGLDVLPDGRLVISDTEADPSGLGAASPCGSGHGALWVLDPTACPACMPQLLADGSNHPFSPVFPSIFGDPIDVAYDPETGLLFVVDACGSPLNYNGSVYSVDPADGRVRLVSSMPEFAALIALDVRPGPTSTEVLLVDQGLATDESVLWSIDTSDPDPETNGSRLSEGTQYSQLEGISIDPAGTIYLVDWGDYNAMSGQFDVPPSIFLVDETIANPLANGVHVNDSDLFVTPIVAAAVPIPRVTTLTPSSIAGATNVILEGSHLFPGLTIDFGPDIAVGTVDFAPGYPLGTALQVLVTPLGGGVIAPGCPAPTFDLALAHPFGGDFTLPAALRASGGNGGIVPGPPRSTRGDATADGLVDGLDLAVLGLHFGREYCDGLSFENDADFNDDDIIDGLDLDILASYFGTRP